MWGKSFAYEYKNTNYGSRIIFRCMFTESIGFQLSWLLLRSCSLSMGQGHYTVVQIGGTEFL